MAKKYGKNNLTSKEGIELLRKVSERVKKEKEAEKIKSAKTKVPPPPPGSSSRSNTRNVRLVGRTRIGNLSGMGRGGGSGGGGGGWMDQIR